MRKKILILVFSNLKHDARVKRQVSALADKYDVTVACHDADGGSNFTLVKFPATRLTLLRKAFASVLLLTRTYSIAYRLLHNYSSVSRKLAEHNFDLVIANDVETLPMAFAISKNKKVFFDAHEYAPRHFEDKWMWRLFFQRFNVWLCERFLHRVVVMTTVSRGLAAEYEKNFGVKPVILTNASDYTEHQPSPVGDNKIRLIHHGIANRSRRLELMIELMNKLDERFMLDLMLLIPGSASQATVDFLEDLKRQAAKNERIKFIQPVKTSEIVEKINAYDIGVFLLPPINFNYANTLPNKFFDFIQARLGIAIGPTTEMADIIREFQNGVVSDDFTPDSLARKLNALTKEEIEAFKSRSARAAQVYNAQRNAILLQQLTAKALDG